MTDKKKKRKRGKNKSGGSPNVPPSKKDRAEESSESESEEESETEEMETPEEQNQKAKEELEALNRDLTSNEGNMPGMITALYAHLTNKMEKNLTTLKTEISDIKKNQRTLRKKVEKLEKNINEDNKHYEKEIEKLKENDRKNENAIKGYQAQVDKQIEGVVILSANTENKLERYKEDTKLIVVAEVAEAVESEDIDKKIKDNIQSKLEEEKKTAEQKVKDTVEKTLASRNVMTKPQYDYDNTLAVTGVIYSPNEDILGKAKKLIHEGLQLPELTIVRACRTKMREGRPGLLKIELDNLESKKKALERSGKLKLYRDLGPKVFLRGSQPYSERMMVKNMNAMMRWTGMDRNYYISKNSVIVEKPPEQGTYGQTQHGQSSMPFNSFNNHRQANSTSEQSLGQPSQSNTFPMQYGMPTSTQSNPGPRQQNPTGSIYNTAGPSAPTAMPQRGPYNPVRNPTYQQI